MRSWRSWRRTPPEVDVDRLFAERKFGRLWTYAVSLPAVRALPVLRRLGATGWCPEWAGEVLDLAQQCPDEVPLGLGFTAHVEIDCGRFPVESVAISPDGKLLATGSRITPPRLWRLPDGEQIAELHHIGARELAFSPDGRYLVGTSRPEVGPMAGVTVWEVSTGRLLRHLDLDIGSELALTDTVLVAASRDGAVRVWDLVSGELLATLPVSERGAARPVISPGGRLLAATAGGPIHDGPSTTRIWRLPTGEPVTTITSQQVSALSFIDDDLLVGACRGTLRLWHAETGEPAGTLNGNLGRTVWEIAVRDGLVAAGGFDRTLRIWDVRTNKALAVRKEDERVTHVTATGNTVVTGNLLGYITRYELPSARSAAVETRYRRVEALAATSETTVSGHKDGKVVIWRSTLRRVAAADGISAHERYALEARAPDAVGAERAWTSLVLALADRRPEREREATIRV